MPPPWVEFEYHESLYSNSTHHKNSCTQLKYLGSHCDQTRSCPGSRLFLFWCTKIYPEVFGFSSRYIFNPAIQFDFLLTCMCIYDSTIVDKVRGRGNIWIGVSVYSELKLEVVKVSHTVGGVSVSTWRYRNIIDFQVDKEDCDLGEAVSNIIFDLGVERSVLETKPVLVQYVSLPQLLDQKSVGFRILTNGVCFIVTQEFMWTILIAYSTLVKRFLTDTYGQFHCKFNLKSFLTVTCGQFHCKSGAGGDLLVVSYYLYLSYYLIFVILFSYSPTLFSFSLGGLMLLDWLLYWTCLSRCIHIRQIF